MTPSAARSTSSERSRSEVEFDPVRQVRAHEYVAAQIRRQITLRLVRPGSVLPSERELAGMFGVSRRTVQQALNTLEAESLIKARRGRFGGTFVLELRDNGQTMSELVARVRRRQHEVLELLEYRRLLEPAIVRMAAESARVSDIAAMRSALRGMSTASDEPSYMRFDTDFHVAVATATHNRYLIKAVEESRLGLNDALSLLPETEIWHSRLSQEHEKIFAAIAAHDPDAAAAAAEAHVRSSNTSVRALLTTMRGRGTKKT
ncbi:MAG TPA: FCD domain-containing protein [Acidimicrobiales bacterium]|nr:FCD domain-containing protein [Acidimicrobiales bacterium]